MLQYNGKSHLLETTSEKFRHELYSYENDEERDSWQFAGLIDQRLSLHRQDEQTAGVDRALEVLQNRVAAAKRERDAQTYVFSLFLSHLDHGRYRCDAQKSTLTIHVGYRAILTTEDISPTKIKSSSKASSLSKLPKSSFNPRTASSGLAFTPTKPAAPTSVPVDYLSVENESDGLRRKLEEAIKFSLITLLACRSHTTQELRAQAAPQGIKNVNFEEVLRSIARPDPESKHSEWSLTDRAYAMLAKYPSMDVYKVNLPEDVRAKVVESATRAFGRLRIPERDVRWKSLIPLEERKKSDWVSPAPKAKDLSRVSSPAVKATKTDPKTGLPKRTESRKVDRPVSKTTSSKENHHSRTSSGVNQAVQKSTGSPNPTNSKHSAPAKSMLNAKPKNPSPLSKSPPVNASDLAADHPVHKKLSAAPSPSKRKVSEVEDDKPRQIAPGKRLKVDRSGTGKTETKATMSERGVSPEHTLKKLVRSEASNAQKNTDHAVATSKSLKRKAAEIDSESAKPTTSVKKTRKSETSSSSMTNGAKVSRKSNGVNGVHHNRADSPHSPYDHTDSDSSPPLELSMRQRVDLAAQFKRYYEKYEKLHRELSAATTLDAEKRDELWRMHDKLAEMKEQIKSGQMG